MKWHSNDITQIYHEHIYTLCRCTSCIKQTEIHLSHWAAATKYAKLIAQFLFKPTITIPT